MSNQPENLDFGSRRDQFMQAIERGEKFIISNQPENLNLGSRREQFMQAIERGDKFTCLLMLIAEYQEACSQSRKTRRGVSKLNHDTK